MVLPFCFAPLPMCQFANEFLERGEPLWFSPFVFGIPAQPSPNTVKSLCGTATAGPKMPPGYARNTD